MCKLVGLRNNLRGIFNGSAIIALTVLSGACSSENSSLNQVSSTKSINPEQQDWVKEELLTQVTGLRKELAELRQEVKTLDGKVSNLNVAGTKPSRPPEVSPNEIILNDPYLMGDDDAKVMVIEFTDYQCPYCARHSKSVLPKIKKNFVDTGKIRYAVRDYPLGFHAQAKEAAIVANCAGDQGKYWEMHETLFNNSRNLSKDFYQEQVVKLGLHADQFQTCIDDPASAKHVEQSLVEGSKYGVSGTPKFFVGLIKDNKIINVKSIGGAREYSVFVSAIEKLL